MVSVVYPAYVAIEKPDEVAIDENLPFLQHLSRWGLTWTTFQALRTTWTSLNSW